MSEEEKKAIENLKNRIEILHNNTQWATENNIKVVLKLIEKQQKEIEELEERNAEQLEVITEWVNGERINDIKHISKDKIREKIKYKEDLALQIYNTTILKHRTKKEDEEVTRLEIEIKLLEELLKEE